MIANVHPVHAFPFFNLLLASPRRSECFFSQSAVRREPMLVFLPRDSCSDRSPFLLERHACPCTFCPAGVFFFLNWVSTAFPLDPCQPPRPQTHPPFFFTAFYLHFRSRVCGAPKHAFVQTVEQNQPLRKPPSQSSWAGFFHVRPPPSFSFWLSTQNTQRSFRLSCSAE